MLWKRHKHYSRYGKVRKVGVFRMAAEISGGLVAAVVCTAFVTGMGSPDSNPAPQYHGNHHHRGGYVAPDGARTTADPDIKAKPKSGSAATPIKPVPLTSTAYYINPDQSFYWNIRNMRDSHKYPTLEGQLTETLKQPVATWLGEWLSDTVQTEVTAITTKAAAAGQIPVLVSYNIPNRDLGQYSAGGVSDATAYAKWTQAISDGIGDRPAVVILEPDALPGIYDMNQADGDARMNMLKDAIKTYAAHNPKTYVYVDSGNSRWLQPSELVALLKNVFDGTGVQPRISLNVSNYRPTAELVSYFNSVNGLYGGSLKALLDIGMNGAATPVNGEDWCNPRGARKGTPDDYVFNSGSQIEQLMVRPLGESSGECEMGDPAAGEFDQDLAATVFDLPSGRYK